MTVCIVNISGAFKTKEQARRIFKYYILIDET
jgi:hypothetical protein